MSPAVNTQPPNPSLPVTSGTQGMQYDNLGRKIGTAPNTESLNAANNTEPETTPQSAHASALGGQLANYSNPLYMPTSYSSQPGTPNQLPVYNPPMIPTPAAPVTPPLQSVDYSQMAGFGTPAAQQKYNQANPTNPVPINYSYWAQNS